MKSNVIRGLCAATVVVAMGIPIVGCSSSAAPSNSSSSAVSASSESVTASSASTDFWVGSEYVNPNRLTEDREFVIAYSDMDGVENVVYDNVEVSDTAETLLIPFSRDFVAFEWGGTKYIPALSQVEVKLGNGDVVQQTYYTMPSEDMAWVSVKGKDTFKGSDVSIRMRAVINPTGGKECAYSKWSDWQDLKVELGPAKGEQKPIEERDLPSDLAD